MRPARLYVLSDTEGIRDVDGPEAMGHQDVTLLRVMRRSPATRPSTPVTRTSSASRTAKLTALAERF